MARNLRTTLTRQFVSLFIILYLSSTSLAIFMFSHYLDKALDDELQGLVDEVLPSVNYADAKPTLKPWARKAAEEHYPLSGTIQLYDANRHLVEAYGPTTAEILINGNVVIKDQKFKVRSLYVPIKEKGIRTGYLQIQISTEDRDEALFGIIATMLVITPVLALAVAVCGSWFAGKAVEPVERSNALLRQFVADAGHEINTPIAVLDASLQTLEEMFPEQSSPVDVLQIIKRGIERMKNLGQSLIVLSCLDTPSMVSSMDVIELDSTFAPVVEECSDLANTRRIALEYKPEKAQVLGNAEALQRMLHNLLVNALTYTESGGKVCLSLNKLPKSVRIEVEDNGMGIPDEALPHIFDRFFRVDKSRSRDAGGSGLGLSIVKTIVENHGGTVSAQSQLGKGTKLIVELPSHRLITS